MATGRNQLPSSAQPKKGKSMPQGKGHQAKKGTKGATPPGKAAC